MPVKAVWAVRNPVLALLIMTVLVWGFLNLAHFGVLITSGRTSALNSLVGHEVQLDLHDGSRVRGKLTSSQMCFRQAIVRWCVEIETDARGGKITAKHFFFEWQIPRPTAVGDP